MRKIMSLCAGRHEYPAQVSGSIFGQNLNPLDLAGMREDAEKALAGVVALDLYVSGLTIALVEVISVCRAHGITLTLWHFDRNTGSYYPQTVG